MPTVRFVYSKSSKSLGGGVHMIQSQSHDVSVPGAELTPQSLQEAETAFVRWFATTFPNDYFLQWIAGPAQGQGRYSEYQLFLPED